MSDYFKNITNSAASLFNQSENDEYGYPKGKPSGSPSVGSQEDREAFSAGVRGEKPPAKPEKKKQPIPMGY